MSYLCRDITQKLEKWLDRREIIAIKGPRQAGKTTILKILQEYLLSQKNVPPQNIIYITFEDRDIMEAFSRDPKFYVKSYFPKELNRKLYFLIDEFQYLQDGGQKLKLLYDIYENVKFIITGSSSLEIAAHTSQYLVGRVFSFYLYQFSFSEYLQLKPQNLQNVYRGYSKEINDFIEEGKVFRDREDIFAKDFSRYFEDFVVFGGYPEVVKSEDIETRIEILKNIYDTYITKDIVELLRIKDLSGFRIVVRLLANQAGNLLNLHTLASDSGSYFRQLRQYISILEETFIIRNLKPYFKNRITELKKNPKTYFVDTGLRNSIVNNFNRFEIRPDAGNLVENAVASYFYQHRGEDLRYWRTLGHAEVDFILKQNDRILPVEVKYSSLKSPKIDRSFKSFITAYQPPRAVVLTKGFWGKVKFAGTDIVFVPAWYAV